MHGPHCIVATQTLAWCNNAIQNRSCQCIWARALLATVCLGRTRQLGKKCCMCKGGVSCYLSTCWCGAKGCFVGAVCLVCFLWHEALPLWCIHIQPYMLRAWLQKSTAAVAVRVISQVLKCIFLHTSPNHKRLYWAMELRSHLIYSLVLSFLWQLFWAIHQHFLLCFQIPNLDTHSKLSQAVALAMHVAKPAMYSSPLLIGCAKLQCQACALLWFLLWNGSFSYNVAPFIIAMAKHEWENVLFGSTCMTAGITVPHWFRALWFSGFSKLPAKDQGRQHTRNHIHCTTRGSIQIKKTAPNTMITCSTICITTRVSEANLRNWAVTKQQSPQLIYHRPTSKAFYTGMCTSHRPQLLNIVHGNVFAQDEICHCKQFWNTTQTNNLVVCWQNTTYHMSQLRVSFLCR